MSAQAVSDTQLRGGRLAFGRVAWFLVAGLGLALNIIGIPLHFTQWETVRGGASCAICQLTPQQAQQLQQIGLSLQFWASYLTLGWILPRHSAR